MARTSSATVLPPTRKSSGTPTAEGLRGAASALAAWRARRGVALDITALPGMAVLSAKVITHQATPALLPDSNAAGFEFDNNSIRPEQPEWL